MTDIAIQVENLSKLYHIGHLQNRNGTLREAIVSTFKSRSINKLSRHSTDDEIWALKDVSFAINRGEVSGVIGRNGAGKSTLLKILSQITEPTLGRAIINGRVGSLLEVGTGFHPELTGRENIYLNGAILGMSRKEIASKFDEILEFAGIERFVDTPVKRYSSGMFVRLAFAVAAHLEPEILLIDEVLAVGDIAFQKKCLNKMEDITKTGRTILFVSHNLQAIGDLCKSTLWIDEGRLKLEGDTSSVIRKYLNSYFLENKQEFVTKESVYFRIEKLIINGDPIKKQILPLGALEIQFDIKPLIQTRDISTHIYFIDEEGRKVIGLDSVDFGAVVLINSKNTARFVIHIPNLTLPPGHYYLSLLIKSYSQNLYDHFDYIASFYVNQNPVYGNRLYDRKFHGDSVIPIKFTAMEISV